MMRVFTERYFRKDYNYIFSLSVVIIANLKRIQIVRKECYFEQVFVFKIWEVLDITKNLSFWYENWKNDKKLREKQKFRYPHNVMT